MPAQLLARAPGRRRARRDRRPGAGPARAPAGRGRARAAGARAGRAGRGRAHLGAPARRSSASATRRSGRSRFDELVRELLKRIVEALAADTAAVVLHEADGTMVVYQAGGAGTAPRRGATRRRRRPPETRRHPSSARCSAARSRRRSRRRWSSTAGRSARCTSARCSPARFTDDHRGAAAARRRPRRDRHPARAAVPARARDRRGAAAQPAAGAAARSCRACHRARATSPPATAPRWAATGTTRVVQPDGRLLLSSATSPGRGIAAASTMGQLRSALRAYALDGALAGRRCSSA